MTVLTNIKEKLYDFVNNNDDFIGIMNFLNEPIKGRKYYNPIKSF